jgi:hypothetical protein
MWMPGGRLLLPAVSLTLGLAGSHLGRYLRPTWPFLVGIGVAMLPVAVGPLPDYVRSYDERHTPKPGNPASLVGDFLREHLPAGSVLATRDAGVLAYHFGVQNRVAELHPRALTQKHVGSKSADFAAYVPKNPEVFALTVADPAWTRWYYPEDQEAFSHRTVRYRYLGRVEQHFRRHYDICVRADLDVPPLPAAWVGNWNAKKLCEAPPTAKP